MINSNSFLIKSDDDGDVEIITIVNDSQGLPSLTAGVSPEMALSLATKLIEAVQEALGLRAKARLEAKSS